MNLPNPSPDTHRLWADTEETLRLLLGRGGLLLARPSGPDGRSQSPLPEETAPALQTGKNERALRALAKEMKRLITEDKRRGLGV